MVESTDVPSVANDNPVCANGDGFVGVESSMAYFLDLFSPETYEAFSGSSGRISGFRSRQRDAASRVQPGDLLICYMTRLSRWIGVHEVERGPIEDDTPI